MNEKKSIAELSLSFTGAYESELLAELMLRHWSHPLASDAEFRHHLLETAAEILNDSVTGVRFIEDLRPEYMNLVAALWMAESTFLANDSSVREDERSGREAWLASIRRSVPSCFCDPECLD
ncbi:MAG: hypothetical protein JSS27_10130 [Planctomycetes bacterium]|nr:hypothetical protein [Planctomycetota bacterium]